MNVSVACPDGYTPDKQILDFALTATDNNFELTNDPKIAAKDADVIFTDVWASMGQEEEMAKRQKAFSGYQVNEEILALANPKCMIQHCLPAHKGEEISEEMFEKHADEIFDEAENRLHLQKAILYLLMR
jgi:ornithine carbamoyltransferase